MRGGGITGSAQGAPRRAEENEVETSFLRCTHVRAWPYCPGTMLLDDLPQGVKMHAQLLAHDNHASGFGCEHGEDSPGNYTTYLVSFFNLLVSDYITFFGPARN